MKKLMFVALCAALSGCATSDPRVDTMWADYTNRTMRVAARRAVPRKIEDPIAAEKRKLADLERKAKAEAFAREQARKRQEREEFLKSLRHKKELSE